MHAVFYVESFSYSCNLASYVSFCFFAFCILSEAWGWTIRCHLWLLIEHGIHLAVFTKSQRFVLREICKNYKMLKGKLYIYITRNGFKNNQTMIDLRKEVKQFSRVSPHCNYKLKAIVVFVTVVVIFNQVVRLAQRL